MGRLLRRSILAASILLLIASSLRVSGYPSGRTYPATFTQRGYYWYDSWGFNRNYYDDADGYMPNLAYETLGTNKELAYSIGESFRNSYSSDVQRAQAILKYIQRWTEYGYDSDNVFMNGEPQDEWAWNADEMAHAFNENTGAVSMGDCEDMAFLGATIYNGAGYDAALVLTDEHVALLIWLPEYSNANYYWDIPNDGRGKGWIWVEATGENNPLGWTPPDFNDGNWIAYLLGMMISNVDYSPRQPQAEDDVTVTASVASAKASVSQAILDYSTSAGVHRTVAMVLQGSSYTATIPSQPKGTAVGFHVSVTDTEGNTEQSDKFSYTVGEEMEIPGFPFESIIVGLAIGLAALYSLARKRPKSPGLGASVHVRSLRAT